MKFYLDVIGCRLNQSEIETMARQLLAGGHEIVPDPATADKAIVNTCTVTREAAKDSRAMTRRIHRQNPNAEIILTGCYATIDPDELTKVEGAGQIVANKDKDLIVPMIDPGFAQNQPVYDQEPILRAHLGSSQSNTRAFIKVQDGCDNRCTFCITTVARGRGVSRHMGDIVLEIQELVNAGYQEAVLTGVHLGSYGIDLDEDIRLTDLVKCILDNTDIPRLRLSSLEPWDIPVNFFDLWRNPRLLPHLHVPLQSGSDRVLKRMARRTNRASYRQIVDATRGGIPFLNLSTDLIAGFPGETQGDFEDTLEFVSEIGFSRLHVFTYSRRSGTAAATMEGQLPKSLRKNRTRQIIELGKELSLAFHKTNQGRKLAVLWERTEVADQQGLRWVGYSDNYIRIKAYGPVDLFNRITPTIVSDPLPEGMTGTILPVAAH
jgi:threonylcarbamoyladenosine tRNA methylthiotransferase MtaB